MNWRCSRCGRVNGGQIVSCCGQYRAADRDLSRRAPPVQRLSVARLGREILAGLGRATDATVLAVPPAIAGPAPVWPVPGYTKFSLSSFGGDRPFHPPHTRYHAGVDIHCPRGTPVVAMEDGKIVAIQGWRSKKGRPERLTKAILLELDSGPVIVYGALIPDSWKAYGLGVGSRVARGDTLGLVGTYPEGDEMAHLEARRKGTRRVHAWYIEDGVPADLLNITPLLQLARKGKSQGQPAPGPPEPAPPMTFARWLQSSLRLLVAPDLAVDGQIGPATKAATRKFQATRGLAVDGVAGPLTIAALERELLTASTGGVGPILDRMLQSLKQALQDVL